MPLRHWALFLLAIGMASCARLGEEKQWNNPFDAGGINWNPPTVTAPGDTNIAVNDTMTLVATGSDPNGTVVKYWWSFDHGKSWPLHSNPERATPFAWGTCFIGKQVVWVKAQDNNGLFSLPDSFLVVVHGYRPVVQPVADTMVSQFASVKVPVVATDTNGSITRYFWRTEVEGPWTDTTETPSIECTHQQGGAVTIVWGAQDHDGFITCDTFSILFNRGPASVEMLSPLSGDTAAFVSFDFIELTGSVRLRFSGDDPDGDDDTLTYTLFLGNGQAGQSPFWTGRDSVRVVPGLEPSESYAWKLTAKDLFGDSIETSGSFRTLRAPNGPAGMTLVRSAGKSFQMGLPGGDSSETPLHTVGFSRHYWIDTTEVTCSEFTSLVEGAAGNSLLPVAGISWFDAVLYCNARSKRDGKDTVYSYSGIAGTPGSGCVLADVRCDFSALGYRLPSEAEWEYAARAGSQESWFWGKNRQEMDRYVWYKDNAGGSAHAVASKQANPLGLYDVYGNVWEWCNDWFGDTYYRTSPAIDPTGPESGMERVIRGGSWSHSDDFAQSGVRSRIVPALRNATIGFRVVLQHP